MRGDFRQKTDLNKLVELGLWVRGGRSDSGLVRDLQWGKKRVRKAKTTKFTLLDQTLNCQILRLTPHSFRHSFLMSACLGSERALQKPTASRHHRVATEVGALTEQEVLLTGPQRKHGSWPRL